MERLKLSALAAFVAVAVGPSVLPDESTDSTDNYYSSYYYSSYYYSSYYYYVYQPFYSPILTVNGPNDGEPLNNSIPLQLTVYSAAPTNIVYYDDRGYMIVLPVKGEPYFGPKSLLISIDSTKYANGLLNLKFDLYSEWMDVHYYTANWSGRIENPTVEVLGKASESSLTVQLKGRTGDAGYLLAAGINSDNLQCQPDTSHQITGVQYLTSGQYPRVGINGTPYKNHVLNLDTLIKIHTQYGYLVLWSTKNGSKWSRSKLIRLQDLLEKLQNSTLASSREDTYSGYYQR